MYKTGDLARYRSEGRIEFLGRIDHQVKIRGFRIELGEIETALMRHPEIQEVVVVALAFSGADSTAEDKRLVAYIVSRKGQLPVADGLRNFLKESLPEYMIPSVFMMLEALPLTPNGKIDRKALPVPSGPVSGEASVLPRTPVEKTLAGIWAEVLSVQGIGVTDDFFDLGGHSLLATRVLSRVRDAYRVDISLRKFFEKSTVEALAAEVEVACQMGTTSTIQGFDDEMEAGRL